MRVLGFDLSTVKSGFAVIGDGELIKKGVICPIDELKTVYETKKSAREAMRDEVVRFRYIVKRAAGIIKETNPDILVVEDSFMRNNASVLRLLARLSGGVLWAWYVLRQEIKEFHKPYLVMASQARAGIGCKGNAKKPEVIQFLRDKYGWIVEDDNEADAAVLALWGYEQQKKTKSRRKVQRRWKR